MSNCDFRESHVLLTDSNIEDIFIRNVVLPRKIDIKWIRFSKIEWRNLKIPYFRKVKKHELLTAKETVQQLRSIANKYNDTLSDINYKVFEQKISYRLTSFYRQPQLKFTQFLNFTSNNFGSNWWLPALEFFGVGFLFYWWIIGVNNLDLNWSTYSQFLIPTHKLEIFGDTNSLKEGTGVIDFFSRIVLGYLIYQFISAFRKFSK